MTEQEEEYRVVYYCSLTRYEVSNLANMRTVGDKPKQLDVTPKNGERVKKSLEKSNAAGTKSKYYLDLIVLHTFVGPPPSSKHTAIHINGDITDSRLVNLKWGIPDKKNEIIVFKGNPVGQYELDGLTLVNRWNHAKELCKELGINHRTLSRALKTANNEINGYRYKYIIESPLLKNLNGNKNDKIDEIDSLAKTLSELKQPSSSNDNEIINEPVILGGVYSGTKIYKNGTIISRLDKVLKPNPVRDGRTRVRIKKIDYYIDELVFKAYNPRFLEQKIKVVHINGDLSDNNLENLRLE